MIDLKKCLSDREGFLVSGTHDELVDLVFSDESDEYAFIGARGFFDTGKKRDFIPDGYLLRGVFELGEIMSGTSLFLVLYVFARQGFKECRFSTLKLEKPLVAKSREPREAGIFARFQSIDSVTISKHIFRLLRTTRTEGPQIVPQGLGPSLACLRKT